MLHDWFTGWAALRTYPTSFDTGYPAALRRDRGGTWEHFIGDPSPLSLATLAAQVRTVPGSTLSVWGHDVQRYVDQAHLAGLKLVSTGEMLMSLDLDLMDAEDPYLADPDFTLSTARLGGRHDSSAVVARYATAIRSGQAMVAWGMVAVHSDVAVFDQTQTVPAFRRRGFGRLVMDALAARALDHPVRQGLLLASPSGQQLYEKLGWRRVCPITVLAVPAPRQ